MHVFDSHMYPTETARCRLETDSTLVLRAKVDSQDFAPLYERYRDDIQRYALHCLGNAEDAADATQQTFTNALAGLARFQDTDDSFRKWLFRIARNEIVSRHRQNARRREHALDEAGALADSGHTPEELAVLNDHRALTVDLLARLTPEQRRCCTLRISGLSHRESAIVLGKSEVAVRATYCRGMATLRELMQDTGP